MDIGQPKDFITGTSLYLNHLKHNDPSKLATGDNFVGPVLVVSESVLVLQSVVKEISVKHCTFEWVHNITSEQNLISKARSKLHY